MFQCINEIVLVQVAESDGDNNHHIGKNLGYFTELK